MKVALVYDRVNKWGGAERVLLALHQMFPDAPLYTSVYNPHTAPWADIFTIKTSFLQRVTLLRQRHELIPFLMPLAFESFDFSSFDLVISVTSESAKGIITTGKTKHLCYCLTPTRYLWSGYAIYFAHPGFTFIAQPAVRYLRRWDTIAAARPDRMIAISKEVRGRIKTYYHRNTKVIYPPLLLQDRREIISSKIQNNPPFLLIVSRLVGYKRVDLAIRACNRLRLPLYIAGIGNDYRRLRAMSGPTIRFLGNLTEAELIAYYTYCQGLIFPGIEDFGLTAVEAQYYGKPVLAFDVGGAKETIIEGKTGMFFPQPTVASLTEKLAKFVKFRYNPSDCRRQAEKFSVGKFKREFIKEVEALI